jgi:hypothetical protein
MAKFQPRSIRDAINDLERFLILRDNLIATKVQAITPVIQRKIAALPGCSLAKWLESEIETLEALTQLRMRLGRLRSSNCNSDTIDGLPDWVVVEKQEHDLPKEAIRQLYYCYKI